MALPDLRREFSQAQDFWCESQCNYCRSCATTVFWGFR
jgi:hypothetical protein